MTEKEIVDKNTNEGKRVDANANEPKYRYRLKDGFHWGKNKDFGVNKPKGPIVELRRRDVKGLEFMFHDTSTMDAAQAVKIAESAKKLADSDLKAAQQMLTESKKGDKKSA